MKRNIADQEVKRQIRFEIEKQLAKGYRKFIIFPFGKIGKIVKEVLNNDFYIQEIGILDNKLCETNDNIEPLEYLKTHPLDEDIYVLIASNKRNIYDELRSSVQNYVSEESILDLCARDKMANEEKILEDIARRVEFDFDNNVYYSKRYKTYFYLPNWRTDEIQKHILFSDRYYEDENLFFLKHFMGDKLSCGTVLDIGANIGNHTLFFTLECGAAKVISFEPVRETYDILCQNISLNKLEDKVLAYNLGVGEKRCWAEKGNYDLENIGATRLSFCDTGTIEICAIDEMAIKDKITLIKIDVEGLEVQVLKGAIHTIVREHPYIMIEAWEHTDSIFDIIKLLYPLNYRYIQISERDYIFYIN